MHSSRTKTGTQSTPWHQHLQSRAHAFVATHPNSRARNSFPVKGDNLAIFQSNYANTACWQKKKEKRKKKTAIQALYFAVFAISLSCVFASSRPQRERENNRNL